MKRTAIVAAILAVALPSVALAQGGPMKVLFIGNSYTYFNNLPEVIGDLAHAAKEPRAFEPTVVVVGGSTLQAHLARGDAQREIARGGWDAIVLQEQSMRPIDDPAAMWRDADTFAASIRASGAKLLYYETWAREATPALQDSLSRSFHRAADRTGGTVVHVGDAWGAFRATESVAPGAHSALFFTDGSHPSTAGTYLAACAFYAALYGKSSVGLPNAVRSTHAQPPIGPAPESPRDSVPSKLAAALQRLASARR